MKARDTSSWSTVHSVHQVNLLLDQDDDEEEGGDSLISINRTLILLALSFGFCIFSLNKLNFESRNFIYLCG